MFKFGISNFVKPGMMFGDWGNGWIKTPDTLIDMDFANGRYFGARVSDLMTNRAMSALAQRLDGSFESFAANVPRITNRGLLVEEARTNLIRNSSGAGAQVGTLPTPGALPTNWAIAGGTGLTRTIVGFGTTDGLSYVDIQFSGNNSDGFFTVSVDNGLTSAYVTGQTYTMSMFLQVVGGSLTNITTQSLFFRYNLSPSGATDVSSSITLNSTLSRKITTGTTTGTLPGSGICFVQFNNTPGAAINVTIRIAAPQLEQASFSLSPILTTSTALTRPADAVYLPISGIGTEYTVYAEVDPIISGTPRDFLNASQDNTINNVLRVLHSSGGTAQTQLRVGGSAIATVTGAALSTSAANKIAVAVTASELRIAVNGVAATAGAIGTPATAPSRLYVGGRSDATAQACIFQKRAAVMPRSFSNAELASLTT